MAHFSGHYKMDLVMKRIEGSFKRAFTLIPMPLYELHIKQTISKKLFYMVIPHACHQVGFWRSEAAV